MTRKYDPWKKYTQIMKKYMNAVNRELMADNPDVVRLSPAVKAVGGYWRIKMEHEQNMTDDEEVEKLAKEIEQSLSSLNKSAQKRKAAQSQ